MNKIIGIDLGTTNSCVAVLESDNPRVIENKQGNRTTPSVVAYVKKNGEIETLVGSEAIRQAVTNPDNTFYSFKRLMGLNFNDKVAVEHAKSVPYEIGQCDNMACPKAHDKMYRPEEISAAVLSYLKDVASSYLGSAVKEAVITVPAYFNDAQRNATKTAGTIAGLDVKRIINEPTAAALAYGLNNRKSGTIAVYDLGGGTFDISVLEIHDGVFEVKATNGDAFLGGEDFDRKIVNYLANEFKKENGIDLREDTSALQRLKEESEKAKKELSFAELAIVKIPFIIQDASGNALHMDIELTRAKLESLVEDLVERTSAPCLNAIKDAGISVSEIDEVVLVGGMTRMPKVASKVEAIFKKKPKTGVNPDEVVAQGAAIQAGVLQGDVKDVLLLDVTPLSLGIETEGGICSKLIERNTTIPTKKSQIFSTAANNQTSVTIRVLQGEREMAVDNKLLGQFDFTGIAPAPRGVPQIEVIFDIDSNGIVHVTAKDKATNKEHSVSIKDSGGMSKEDVEKLVREAEENKEKDMEKKKLIETKNKADALISSTEKALGEHGDKLDDETKSKIEADVESLKGHKESDDIKVIEDAINVLQDSSMKLGEIVYKEAQQKQNESTDDKGESVKDAEHKEEN